jgi:acetyl esterase/lipase
MYKKMLFFAAMAAFCAGGWAQSPASTATVWPPSPDHITMPIWPGTPPGTTTNLPPETDVTTPTSDLVAGQPVIRLSNVSVPTITLYKPKVQGNGTTVVVFPGGGYRYDSIDLEGTEVCGWLNSINVTCALLKYRVPGSGPYPKSAAALQDAQRAMGMVRLHVAEWGIDPHRVGVMGFSAGGYLAAAISNLYQQRLYETIDAADQLSCRPDFAVVVYPGALTLPEQNFAVNPAIHPTADTPQTFILQAEDDYTAHVENAVAYFMELKNAKVPAELHIYAQGGHGFGLRPRDLPVMGWPKLLETWMHTIKMLPAE